MLTGAAAMGFHRVVRATEDLNLFIQATTENVGRLKQAFRAGDPLGDYPTVRYEPPTLDPQFEVITRLGDVASFETVAQENTVVKGIRVRVATPPRRSTD